LAYQIFSKVTDSRHLSELAEFIAKFHQNATRPSFACSNGQVFYDRFEVGL
jgi:aminoglycoside phosphotransferase family enzyme